MLSSRLLLVKYALKLALLPYFADRKRVAFEIGANFGTWVGGDVAYAWTSLTPFETIPRFAPVP